MSLVADAMSGEQEKRPPVFSYARGGDLRPGVVQTGEPQPRGSGPPQSQPSRDILSPSPAEVISA